MCKINRKLCYLIIIEEMETTIEILKCRKSPGSEGIKDKFFKHTPKNFYINFLTL